MISHSKGKTKSLAVVSKCRCMIPMLFPDPLSHGRPSKGD